MIKDFRTQPKKVDPESVIQFTELYDTHRIGFYKDWLIVQPFDEMDGDIFCINHTENWEDTSFSDLGYLKDYFTAEWETGNLQEIIDFIDNY